MLVSPITCPFHPSIAFQLINTNKYVLNYSNENPNLRPYVQIVTIIDSPIFSGTDRDRSALKVWLSGSLNMDVHALASLVDVEQFATKAQVPLKSLNALVDASRRALFDPYPSHQFHQLEWTRRQDVDVKAVNNQVRDWLKNPSNSFGYIGVTGPDASCTAYHVGKLLKTVTESADWSHSYLWATLDQTQVELGAPLAPHVKIQDALKWITVSIASKYGMVASEAQRQSLNDVIRTFRKTLAVPNDKPLLLCVHIDDAQPSNQDTLNHILRAFESQNTAAEAVWKQTKTAILPIVCGSWDAKVGLYSSNSLMHLPINLK